MHLKDVVTALSLLPLISSELSTAESPNDASLAHTSLQSLCRIWAR